MLELIIELLLHYSQNQNPSKRRRYTEIQHSPMWGLMILRGEERLCNCVTRHTGQPFATLRIYIANTHLAAGLCNTRETLEHTLLSFIITKPCRECSRAAKGLNLSFFPLTLTTKYFLYWLYLKAMQETFTFY